MASHANQNAPRQGFLHGAFILTVGAMLAKIVGALFKIPLTRLIGTEGAGHFNAAYNIYIVLLNVSSTGLPLAVSRLISEADALKQTDAIQCIRKVSLRLFLLIGGVCSIGMFFGAGLLANWIRDPEAVLCGTQTLTDEQKAQARANIGALTEAEMKVYVEQEILGGAW